MPDKREIQSAGRPVRTVRLVFSYQGDEVRLVSRQKVDMIPPAPTGPPMERGAAGRSLAAAPAAGCWYEVRDAGDRALLRQPMADPIRRDVEVFSPDPGRSIRRAPQANPRGTFVVLVPDLPEGREVVLLAAPGPGAGFAADARAEGGVREIARVALDDREGGR